MIEAAGSKVTYRPSDKLLTFCGVLCRLPSNRSNRPSGAAIEWHLDTKFLR